MKPMDEIVAETPDLSTTDIERELKRPRFVMMNGAAGVGKSRWVEQFLEKTPQRSWVVVSADALMNAYAIRHQMTVDQVLQNTQHGKACFEAVLTGLATELRQGKNVIFDVTEVKSSFRKGIVGFVGRCGHCHHTTCVDILTSSEEQQSQIRKRNHLTEETFFPDADRQLHMQMMEPPSTAEEGFDLVLTVPSKVIKEQRRREMNKASGRTDL